VPEELTWLHERAEVIKALAILEEGVRELRGDMAEFRGALGQLLGEAKESARTTNGLRIDYENRCKQIDSVRLSLKATDKRIDDVEREVGKITPVVRVVVWIGGGLGLSILALIWSLIIGQVQLVFK
jgi:hypothetical protein